MAADALGLPPFTIINLANELVWPHATQIGIIEGAGGIHSPLADDGDILTLLDTIWPDLVIIVAAPQLGTINNIRLTTTALQQHPHIVLLNRYNPDNELHHRNHQWLSEHDQIQVTATIPHLLLAIRTHERTVIKKPRCSVVLAYVDWTMPTVVIAGPSVSRRAASPPGR
jgi:dethiobiotin synthetase